MSLDPDLGLQARVFAEAPAHRDATGTVIKQDDRKYDLQPSLSGRYRLQERASHEHKKWDGGEDKAVLHPRKGTDGREVENKDTGGHRKADRVLFPPIPLTDHKGE